MQDLITASDRLSFNQIEIKGNRKSARLRLGKDYGIYIRKVGSSIMVENLNGDYIMFEEDYMKLKNFKILKQEYK